MGNFSWYSLPLEYSQTASTKLENDGRQNPTKSTDLNIKFQQLFWADIHAGPISDSTPTGAVLEKNILGEAGPSSFGRQQRL